MIQTGHFRRKARLLTALCASFAVVLLGTEAVAGDKQKSQKALDQRAAQMQAKGTVLYSDGCLLHGEEGSGGEIKSINELKRLLLSGKYQTRICVVSGSQPERFSDAYRRERGLYFLLASNPNIVINVFANYSYGSSWNVIGTKGDYDVMQKSFDPKKTKTVQSSYPGAASVYLALRPIGSNYNFYSGNDGKRNCENARNNGGAGEYFSPCLIIYPQLWDQYIANISRSALLGVQRQNPHNVTFDRPDP